MHSSKQVVTARKLHFEPSIACAILDEQGCILSKPDAEKRSTLGNPQAAPSTSRKSWNGRLENVCCAIALSVLRLSTVATLTLSTEFYKVRLSCEWRASSPRKEVWLKQNGSKKPFIYNVDRASNCTRTSFGRANTSAKHSGNAKIWNIITAFFELKKDTPNPVVAER